MTETEIQKEIDKREEAIQKATERLRIDVNDGATGLAQKERDHIQKKSEEIDEFKKQLHDLRKKTS